MMRKRAKGLLALECSEGGLGHLFGETNLGR